MGRAAVHKVGQNEVIRGRLELQPVLQILQAMGLSLVQLRFLVAARVR